MPKTTKKHFDLFVSECQFWIDFYGLQDWEFSFLHNDHHKNALAHANVEHKDKMAVLTMAITWAKNDPISEEAIRLIAHHEVAEVLLSKLDDLGTSRYTTAEAIEEARHAIIIRLQNSVFKNRKVLQTILPEKCGSKTYQPVLDGEGLIVPPLIT